MSSVNGTYTHVLKNGWVKWTLAEVSSEGAEILRSCETVEQITDLVAQQKHLGIRLPVRYGYNTEAKSPVSTSSSDAHSRQVGGTHYKDLAVEPWKAMKSWLTREEFIGFLRGNIIKYHARANSGKGTREENLQKAGHYQQALDEFIKETPLNDLTK